MTRLRLIKFIMDEIFPGGRLPQVAQVTEHATAAGFNVTRVQPLRPNYARTLDNWAANLESAKVLMNILTISGPNRTCHRRSRAADSRPWTHPQ